MIELLLHYGFDTLEYSWLKATIGICTLVDYSVAKKHQQWAPHVSAKSFPPIPVIGALLYLCHPCPTVCAMTIATTPAPSPSYTCPYRVLNPALPFTVRAPLAARPVHSASQLDKVLPNEPILSGAHCPTSPTCSSTACPPWLLRLQCSPVVGQSGDDANACNAPGPNSPS
jgi:hypothetical protein